jgi:protein-S-isoprenylcysteine O-methyltransferase Ste14
MRLLSLAALAAGLVAFFDTLGLTLRQRYVAHRSGERRVLLGIELNLVLAWAAGRWLLRLDRPLAPPAAEPWLAAAGLAVVLASVALAVWAKVRLGRWFSANLAVKPGHELVTDGPYAVTRHPIYTGLLGAAAGAGLAWNSPLTLALAAAVAVPLYLHTVFEEHLFEDHFGDAWRAYRARVPRLVPVPRPGGA